MLTPAEKKRDAERRTEERRARERRKAERTATERTRERKRWWEGAEHRFGRSGVDAGESAPRPPPRRRNRRYGTDYSCSSDERYAPNDPATRSEREDHALLSVSLGADAVHNLLPPPAPDGRSGGAPPTASAGPGPPPPPGSIRRCASTPPSSSSRPGDRTPSLVPCVGSRLSGGDRGVHPSSSPCGGAREWRV